MLKEGVRLDRVRGGRQKYRRHTDTQSMAIVSPFNTQQRPALEGKQPTIQPVLQFSRLYCLRSVLSLPSVVKYLLFCDDRAKLYSLMKMAVELMVF